MLPTIPFKLLSSHLPSKTLQIKIYRALILHIVLYGCETWCLTLREEQIEDVWEQGAEGSIWT